MEQQELIADGAAEIAQSLFGEDKDAPPVVEDPPTDTPPVTEDTPPADGGDDPPADDTHPVDTAPVRSAPSSWAKDKHELWAKLDPAVQDQIELREKQIHEGIAAYKEHHQLGKTLNDVMSPYRPMIQAAGLDDAKAVASLLNAHYRLTQGSPEQRLQVYQQLGRDLGLAAPVQQRAIPPEIQHILNEQAQIKSALMQRQNAEYNDLLTRTTGKVESFAKDHPYFDECASEIVAFINAGEELESAYEKAVRANPSTWAKEKARLEKETETKIREKSKKEVGAARQAMAGNVRGRDTGRTPTEPKGKFLDDASLLKTYDAIVDRATH